MPKRVSQQEAEQRYLNKKLVLVDKYIDSTTKVNTLCYCGKYFLSRPSDIFPDNRTTSCGCKFLNYAKNQKHKDFTGQTFDDLTVLSLDHIKKDSGNRNQSHWLCLCKCGNKTVLSRRALYSQSTCGCSKARAGERVAHNLVEQKFNRLTVISLESTHPRKYLCECECGRQSIVQSSHLKTNHTTGCGHCKMKRNGMSISQVQLDFYKIINKGVLNFKSGPYYIDIALVVNGKKIAIEYDSWAWHWNKQDKDIKRTKYLIENGWSVYSIKSDYLMPSIQEIYEGLEKIIKTGYVYTELKMPDWGIRKFKKKNYKNKKVKV